MLGSSSAVVMACFFVASGVTGVLDDAALVKDARAGPSQSMAAVSLSQETEVFLTLFEDSASSSFDDENKDYQALLARLDSEMNRRLQYTTSPVLPQNSTQFFWLYNVVPNTTLCLGFSPCDSCSDSLYEMYAFPYGMVMGLSLFEDPEYPYRSPALFDGSIYMELWDAEPLNGDCPRGVSYEGPFPELEKNSTLLFSETFTLEENHVNMFGLGFESNADATVVFKEAPRNPINKTEPHVSSSHSIPWSIVTYLGRHLRRDARNGRLRDLRS